MNIAIVAPSPVPFQMGGAERLFWGLTEHINSLTPHQAELIKVPCLDRKFWPLIQGYQAFYQLDLRHFDMVISTKYPAWAVEHPNHHLYMQHTSRKVYDLYFRCGRPLEYDADHPLLKPLDRILQSRPSRSRLPELFDLLLSLQGTEVDREHCIFPGPLTRVVIHWLDRAVLGPDQIKTYNAISANVAQRADYFPPGSQVRVIHHPSGLKDFFTAPGEYIFAVSRLEDLKRVDLLLEAYARVNTDVRLCIAGVGGREKKLKKMAVQDPRVFLLGYVSDHDLLEHYARALFVPFISYDEDFGLITVEAMASGKPVLTTTDSGGIQELVRPGQNGLVVEPNPESLARAMDELLSNPEETRQMGQRARQSVASITWENTVLALLGQKEPATVVSRPEGADRWTQSKKQEMRNPVLSGKIGIKDHKKTDNQAPKTQPLDWEATHTGEDSEKTRLQAGYRQLAGTVDDLLTRMDALEQKVHDSGDQAGAEKPAQLPEHMVESEEKHLLDAMYVSFEDRFRGSREEIKERQRFYLPYILDISPKEIHGSIVDLGCGRGEWLELLGENGYEAVGVDSNRVMVQECLSRGLKAREMNALSFLHQCSDSSLAAITGFHIIEHLPFTQMVSLLDQALRVLYPEGLLILETPNPENILIGACYFYADPSHVAPILPKTLAFMAEYRGFRDLEIKKLQKYSDRYPVQDSDPFKEKWFYCPMDYALIGYK